MAASTTRSFSRRRPPPCWRCGTSGSNGCASSHNGSGHHFSTSLIADQRYRPPNNTKRDAGLSPRQHEHPRQRPQLPDGFGCRLAALCPFEHDAGLLRGAAVTEIAMRSGYIDVSRLAANYRAAAGESPPGHVAPPELVPHQGTLTR